MKIVLFTMPATWEQDQHDFMNQRISPFRWLKIKPLVNVVPSPSLLYLAPFVIADGHDVVTSKACSLVPEGQGLSFLCWNPRLPE